MEEAKEEMDEEMEEEEKEARSPALPLSSGARLLRLPPPRPPAGRATHKASFPIVCGEEMWHCNIYHESLDEKAINAEYN